MRYMLLLYSCDTDEDPMATAAEYDAFTAEVRERGAFLDASPLEGASTATSVRVRSGETLVTDGPFAETREQLGGYYVVDCPDLETALELAAKCPAAKSGTVEVRPVMEIPGLHRDDVEGPAAG